MRKLYTILFYLILPFIFLRLLWRGRNIPEYRQRLSERLGYYPFQMENCIWIHAVSVGEVIASVPLVKKLKKAYPHIPFLMTTMTATGAIRVNSLLSNEAKHAYIPYDLPGALERFIKKMKPRICLIMETELWPNLLSACDKHHIPICLLNARLSEKSYRGYNKISFLTKNMLNKLQIICSQGHRDAERFIQLGAKKDKIVVTGNVKFDLQLPVDLTEKSLHLRKELGSERFIWIAASTHELEENLILSAHQKILNQNPNALLILVPRHPERFDEVFKLCESFKTIRRSQSKNITSHTQVYLADTMGELLLLYGASDVSVVCGSFFKRGGHNILEPAALQKPIISGPSYYNFQEIVELFLNENALKIAQDENNLTDILLELIQDKNKRDELGLRAKNVIDANKGAVEKQFSLVEKILSTESPAFARGDNVN